MWKVEKVINGNTIVVSPNWNLGGVSGNEVIVRGYEPIHSETKKSFWYFLKSKRKKLEDIEYQKWKESDSGKEFAELLCKQRLKLLLLGKYIDLRNYPHETYDCIENNKSRFRIFLNGVDVSYYFIGFKQNKL